MSPPFRWLISGMLLLTGIVLLALALSGCSGPVTTINPPPVSVPAPIAAPIPPPPPVVQPPPPPPIPMPLPCHCATLTWTAPTTNTNGTPLTDLAGFNLHYWDTPAHDRVLSIANAMATSQVIILIPGTWNFALTAYNTAGAESALSDTVTKVIL